MNTTTTKNRQPKETVHINSRQQIIDEIVNPEIDKKRKKAIAQSPPIRECDLKEVPGMPRTWIQFKPGNEDEKMEHFRSRVGKANLGGLQSSKKSNDQTFE